MSKKIIMGVTALLAVVLLFTIAAPTFAVDPSTFNPDQSSEAANKFTNASNVVIGVVQVIGTAVAIVMLIWLGIKYVVAAPDEKASIKKSAFIYVIAAIFIFAASNILAIIQNFSQDLTE